MKNDSYSKHKSLNQAIQATFNRRTFLQKLLISSSSLALYGCGGGGGSSESVPDDNPPESPTDIPGEVLSGGRALQSIIIVGAGITGLVAGLELSIAGHEVIFLEARERGGGRVHTLYTPFVDDQFAEAGASRIPSNHNLTLDYINYFGLTVELFYPTSDAYFRLTDNQTELIDAAEYISQPPWPGSVNRSSYQKIAGGMSRLPNAFINMLSSNINFSQPVEIITQNDLGVEVTTTDGNVYTADRALCTVPVPVLNKIQFTPELSTEKNQASNDGYHYTDSSRLYTQFSERFWQGDGLNGWGETDHPEEIWHPTWNESGEKGIIQSYLRGTPAEHFDFLNPQQQIADVHNRWRRFLPDLDNYILGISNFSWAKEIWSGSGYASPTDEQAMTLKPHLSAIEGRIHFAGEHASEFPGWIQGALESGIRAAKEIHSRS